MTTIHDNRHDRDAAAAQRHVPYVQAVAAWLLCGLLLSRAADNSDTPAPTTDNLGLGHLTAPSLSPGYILRPSSLFVLSAFRPRGSSRLDFDLHWANVWAYEPGEYRIDGEWWRGCARFTYTPGDRLAAGLALPIIGRTGGFADGAIEGFHQVFGFGTAHRDEFPRNHTETSVRLNGENKVLNAGDSWGLGDVTFFLASRLSDGDALLPALSLQGELSLPTGDSEAWRGLGTIAAGLSLMASKRLGRSPFLFFGGLSLQYTPTDDITGIEMHREVWAALAGLECRLTPSFSLLAQYLGSSPIAKDFFAFSEPCHEVSAGFKWRLRPTTTVEFGVVENILIFDNSADIGAHLGLGWDL